MLNQTSPTSLAATAPVRLPYAYAVKTDHSLLRAEKNARAALADFPAPISRLAVLTAQECQHLHDAVLWVSATGEPETPMEFLNATCATIELADRYRARTLHPVIASGDHMAAMSWAMHPDTKRAALASLDTRKTQLEAELAQIEREQLPMAAIN